jgi:hypothetical protein
MKIAQYIPFLVGEFRAIDELRGQGLDTPRSPEFKTNVAVLVGAMVLFLMNFVVIGGPIQGWVQGAAIQFVISLPEGATRATLLDVVPLARNIYWVFGCLICYIAIPGSVIKFVFREKLSAFGMSPRGFFKHLPLYLLLFVPVLAGVVVVSYTKPFQNTYPFYHSPHYVWDMLLWDFLYCLQFFGLEFFYRGFLVHSMKFKLGTGAVWLMVLPYMMIHFTKPGAEAFGAIIAGTVLGVLSIRTNSIWGGVFIHCAVAVAMDWASLMQRGALPWMVH